MIAIKFEGSATVKSETTKTSDCKACGPKTETEKIEATYAVDVKASDASGTSGAAAKSVQLTERQLYQAVVKHCDDQNASRKTEDGSYHAAKVSAIAVLALLDERDAEVAAQKST